MNTIKKVLKDTYKNYPNIDKYDIKQYLLFILQKDNSFLIAYDDYVLDDLTYQKFENGIQKLAQGVPLAYIIGIQHFYNYDFFVNECTLIPRFDTETVVNEVLNIIDNFNTKTILDMGTGTGCIGITLKLQRPDISVSLSDKYIDALNIAKKNANHLDAKVDIIQSDWFDNILQSYDIIVSNPPYIQNNDEHLKNLTHEPITALTSGDDGLDDMRLIVYNAHKFLNNHGFLVLEHGYNQKQDVQQLFKQASFCHIQTRQDLGGNDRVTFGQWIQ